MELMDIREVLAQVPEQVRLLRRRDFLALAEQGAFEDEDVELLFGFVVVREQPNPEHEEACSRIARRLTLQLGERADVRTNLSLAASEYSLPRPDVFVLPVGDYWHEHPSRAHLVVEVARTSLRKDREVKRRLYGLADVEEYWIVNLVEREVEVYRGRVDGAFQARTLHQPGEILRPIAFPDVSIAVADIVPPPQG